MVKVVVILLLSLEPEMGMEIETFSAIVVLPMETYFELVWSRFSTNDEGIWNFSTLLTISCKNISSTSFFANAGISIFPVVPARLTKPMRWNRHLAQVHTRNFTWLSSCSGCLLTKASANVMATAVLTTSPRYLVFYKKVWIILSRPPRRNDLPLFFVLMTLLGDRFWDIAFCSSSWFCFPKVLTVLLSFNPGNLFLK